MTDQGIVQTQKVNRPTVTKYSINKKCLAGTVYDSVFGECLYCEDMFGCKNCDESGCLTCESGHTPIGGKCLIKWNNYYSFFKILFFVFFLGLNDLNK